MISISPQVLKQITDRFNNRKKAIGLSGYNVKEMIGQGGSANVYRVSGRVGSPEYVLRISEELKSSYSSDVYNMRELNILQELKKNSQPHVVQYLDAFVVDIPGQPRYYCAVMKFLLNLKRYRVNGDGVEIAVRLGCDFLPLLQSFMDKKILHRDIKPENIYYDGDFRNETGFLLGDFGIAKHDTNTSVTPTGTETTMAPEVRGLDRELGMDRSFSDMYSLGIVMYRYLNQGVYPSNRERIDKMPPDKNPFPEPRYGSKRLKAVVLKATSYYPDNRFESPQAMLRELQKCVEYRKYILNEAVDADTDFEASMYMEEENLRLRRQLQENKATIEKLSQKNANEKKADSAPNSSPDLGTLLKNPVAVSAILCFIIVMCVAAITVIAVNANHNDVEDSSGNTDDGISPTSSLSEVYSAESEESEGIWDLFPSEEEKEETSSENEPLDVEVGDYLTFGNYPQEADGSILPIAWRVIEIKNNKALILSDELLDYIPYNDTKANVTWETSSLRKWLNSYFLNTAFNSDEKQLIATASVDAQTNLEFNVEAGNSTKDRIFVLSITEAMIYFDSDSDRIAYSTAYTHSKGKDSAYSSDWWVLRSPGSKRNRAASVTEKGKIDADGNDVNHAGIAVRPALWLKLQ